MDKATNPSLFVNDGSFMERFRQLQQEKEKKPEILDKSRSGSSKLVTSSQKTVISNTSIEFKANGSRKPNQIPSSGKLAFSLKQKSKLLTPPVKFEEDGDEDDKNAGNSSDDGPMKRQKLSQFDISEQSSKQIDVAPPPPSDPTVRKVVDKLASFVAKNGRQFEHVTKQKNPGDTPFKFLFDESCPDYKYYEYRLSEEEKALSQTRDSQTSESGNAPPNQVPSRPSTQRLQHQHSKYQIPPSALYETTDHKGASHESSQTIGRYGESSAPSGSDPIAMMEYYMKKAAEEEKLRPHKQSKDEMPPPASLQASKKGHHMGDYIPPEELDKFLATCNDAAAQKVAKEYADRMKIQADNVGHRLLSKMGWKEGEGLGSSRSGFATPVMAGDVKKDNLGVGAHAPGEVSPDDDIYEQYKKRMMLGYRHRPNPLNNPRKAYY
ncbi:SURP and G-patch domain-containing protein 1-like protein [Salvia divinorum]|uniref:SURP and G-patch domain-containing protein 1-like protein n=1 Tax=Salvia divinorum TaxID=28513 RepID=A0ABD1I1S4_SALDI